MSKSRKITSNKIKTVREPHRIQQMQKLLDILETPAKLLGGGGKAPKNRISSKKEAIMKYQLNALRTNFTNDQYKNLAGITNDAAYIQPAVDQRVDLTSEVLTGLLNPNQIREFKQTKLVNINTMSDAQLRSFVDMSMGYVMGRVLDKEQFSRWSNQQQHELSYRQAQALAPLLGGRGMNYNDVRTQDVSSNLNHLGSLTYRPMSDFIADHPRGLVGGGGGDHGDQTKTNNHARINKIDNIKGLIKKIEMTLKNIQNK